MFISACDMHKKSFIQGFSKPPDTLLMFFYVIFTMFPQLATVIHWTTTEKEQFVDWLVQIYDKFAVII